METRIAIIGEFQDGKSTLINALMGRPCAETGCGMATTDNVHEYALLGTDCILMDTPGFNSTRETDSETTIEGAGRADAFILMLSGKQASPNLLDSVELCMRSGTKGQRPLIPIINNRNGSNGLIQDNSAATMKKRGLYPILFGKEMPCFNAKRWERSIVEADDIDGMRQLKYLLGIEPEQIPSPLSRICEILQMMPSTRNI